MASLGMEDDLDIDLEYDRSWIKTEEDQEARMSSIYVGLSSMEQIALSQRKDEKDQLSKEEDEYNDLVGESCWNGTEKDQAGIFFQYVGLSSKE